jgi:hypothetical protein
MSKQDAKKNFELANYFSLYALKHPEVVEGVGKRASIVTVNPSDKRQAKSALELARTLKREGRVVYTATKKGNRWEVVRFRMR